MTGRQYRASVRVTGLLLLVLLAGAVVEGMARLTYALKDDVRSLLGMTTAPPLSLDEYEQPDPRHPGNWRLRPGFSRTLDELIEEKRHSGNLLAVQHLTERGARLGIAGNDVIMRIDLDGFKGPELDRGASRPRVLTLGDSCTFGSWFDRYSYPRTLEREWHLAGLDIEVVNGGVEGYGPANVLHRIDEFKALAPRMTTLYIGWNALYAERPLVDTYAPYLRSPQLLADAFRVIRRVAVGPGHDALAAYSGPKHPDRHAPAVRRLERYRPPSIQDVERIVTEMQSAGSTVVLVTLPGLYVMNEEPSATALAIGHLPTFTDNPYVLAKLTEQYNGALRELAERRGLGIVDLDRWSQGALRPREAWFTDSVHLAERGQEMIGQYMARELLPVVSAWTRR